MLRTKKVYGPRRCSRIDGVGQACEKSGVSCPELEFHTQIRDINKEFWTGKTQKIQNFNYFEPKANLFVGFSSMTRIVGGLMLDTGMKEYA